MRLRPPVLVLMSVFALLLAGYCFLAYIMNASFSVASDNRRYIHLGIIWGTAGLVSIFVAALLALIAWKRRGSA